MSLFVNIAFAIHATHFPPVSLWNSKAQTTIRYITIFSFCLFIIIFCLFVSVSFLLIVYIQTWYLSLISLILLVEKELLCEEISAFFVWQLWENWKFLHKGRNFRCLHMTDVEKSEILHIWHVCDVAIYAKNFATI